MKLKSIILFLLSVVLASATIIPAGRLADWSGVGVSGGIPARATISATLNPGASVAEINAAISACPSGQVVKLSAGTYNLAGTINLTKSGVTLRGSGNATVLNFQNVPAESINMSGSGFYTPSPITSWTAGYPQGTTVITVASNAGFSVGQIAALDQINDSDYIGCCGEPGAIAIGNDTGGNHLQLQEVEITGISGTQITISPGLFMPNWSGTKSPRLLCYSTNPLISTGLEDMKIVGSPLTSNGDYKLILMSYTKNCWIKNVDFINGMWAQIEIDHSIHPEVRHCYFRYGGINGVPRSYSILAQISSGMLVEDNIFHGESGRGANPMLLALSLSGSVVGYNLFEDMSTQICSPLCGDFMGYTVSNHSAHTNFNLYEGNVAPQLNADYIHGSSSHATILRNRFVGLDWLTGNPIGHPPTQNTMPVHMEAYQRYYNFVGNLLGLMGYNNVVYQTISGNNAIYRLGQATLTSPIVDDPLAISTMIRHGNWDSFNNGQVWDSGISDHTIPNSYYLNSTPSWFGSLTWPPFDPATPANNQKTRIPAGYRYVNGIDPGGTPTPTPTPTATPTPTITPTPTPTATPSPTAFPFRVPGTINAVDAQVFSGVNSAMTIQATPSPIGSITQLTQNTDPATTGYARYTLDVSATGDYWVKGSLNMADGGSNSLFIKFGGQPTILEPNIYWEVYDFTTNFEDRYWTETDHFTRQLVHLDRGLTTLWIGGREAGAYLSTLTIEARIAPTATTNAVSDITDTTANFNGVGSANGSTATRYYEWGTTIAYGNLTTVLGAGSAFTTDEYVPEAITGLTPATGYHCRLVLENDIGVTLGSDVTFTTASATPTPTPTPTPSSTPTPTPTPSPTPLPIVSTGTATSITINRATVNATVNPNGATTLVSFEWGTSILLGQTTAQVNAGHGVTDTAQSVDLTGLLSGTAYFYRVRGENDGGVSYGSVRSFVTTPLVQSATLYLFR